MARKATRGVAVGGGLSLGGRGRAPGLMGGSGEAVWGRMHRWKLRWPVSAPRAPEKYLEILCPGARKVSWLLQSDFPGKGTS